MNRLILTCILMLMFPFATFAQSNLQKQETAKVYFRINSATLRPDYMDNGATLDRLSTLLKPFIMDSVKTKGRVHIISSASPEGSTNTNDRLIEGRAKAIANWISNRFDLEVGYEVDQMGVDWETFETLVKESSQMPSRDKVLEIFRNVPASDVYTRQQQLKALDNGVPYQWMLTHIYPKLRYAAVNTEIWYASEFECPSPNPMHFEAEGGEGHITFEKNVVDKVVPAVHCDASWITDIVTTSEDLRYRVSPNTATEARSAIIHIECYGKNCEVTVIQEAAAPVVEPEPVPEPVVEPVVEDVVEEPACKRNFYMSVSNNALYDLLLIPNIGAEIYLGKEWSLDANWHYSWWKNDNSHRYWRTYGGDLALRKWFGKKAMEKPLTGHHIGLYGQMITYDFEFGGKGYLGDRWSWAVGAEYGYSLPIARRLNLDFAIGIGYHWGKYKEYTPIDGHYVWQATKNRKFFGPTKAEVSLVWLIGCDNYNRKKGGKK